MMGKSRLFDNIMQVIRAGIAVVGAATQSLEVDLELPRGYIAKIHKIIVDYTDVFSKAADGEDIELLYALLLDPDDAATIIMPNNTVEHDVILSGMFNIDNTNLTTGGINHDSLHRIYDFSHLEGLDIISARNLRFNVQSTSALFDDSDVNCYIYYTLEKIQDAQIMELLDIL